MFIQLLTLMTTVGSVYFSPSIVGIQYHTFKPTGIKTLKPDHSLANSVLSSNVTRQLGSKISYQKSGSFAINNNKTDLDANVNVSPYVNLSKLDKYNRPGVANAFLNKSSRMYQNRKTTGNSKTINPVGWHQVKVNKSYVYNRGHSIGYAIAGSVKGFDASEANKENITTQTAWANQASLNDSNNTGQNYYEGLVRKTLDSKKGVRVRYRVTPVYDGSNLVPSGTHMEAKSSDGSLNYNVFVPNVQTGVQINYKTGIAHAN